VAASDDADLFLSTDATKANAHLIAQEIPPRDLMSAQPIHFNR